MLNGPDLNMEMAQPISVHGSSWRTLRLRRVQVMEYAAFHLACLLGPLWFTWSGLTVCVVLFFGCGGLGVTLGYHRLITHRSFKTYKLIEYLLAIIGCTNMLDGPITWCGTHRTHHAHADREQDPHTTLVSFWWAHVEWFFFRPPLEPDGFCNDLLRDKGMIWIERLHQLPPLLLTALLFGGGYALAGWHAAVSWVIWGVCIRTVLAFHVAGLVNSATHLWGYRNFDTPDNSRNLFWVAMLTMGEGWHNNHHAQQRSATHGMLRGEFDLTYQAIRLLRRIGLAWDVVQPVLPRPPKNTSDRIAHSDENSAVAFGNISRGLEEWGR